MTHLIIHPKIVERNRYLLEFLSQNLGRQFTEIIQLHNIADIHIIENLQTESIGIEEVKLLQKEMIFHPLELPYQAGIIFHSQNLTPEAQNALLKTLEEQPDTTLYILLVDNEKNLLETIVSRCTKHYIKSNSDEQISNIKNENDLSKPEILTLDLVDQFELIGKTIEGENNELAQLIDDLNRHFKSELEKAITGNDQEKAKTIISILNKISTAQTRMKANANKKVTLENMMLQIKRML